MSNTKLTNKNIQSEFASFKKAEGEKMVLVSNIGSMSRKYFVYGVATLSNKDGLGVIESQREKPEIREIFSIQFDMKDYHPELKDLKNSVYNFFEIAKRDFGFDISDLDIVLERVVAVGEYFLEHREIDSGYFLKLNRAARYDMLHTKDLITELENLFRIKDRHEKSINSNNKNNETSGEKSFKIIGVSDSAFHATIPREIYTYGVSEEENAKREIRWRRYGYHGISMSEVARNMNEDERVIAIHLGGGGSVTAMLDGKSIYNSFGMTPVSGLMNMTRVGDIDPLAVLDIYEKNKKSFSLLDDIDYQLEKTKREMYQEGGMCALSGHKDMREVLEDLKSKDKESEEYKKSDFALEVYINKILKEVGSAYAYLGGCDTLALTGSILEKSDVVRERLLAKLKFLNLKDDQIHILKTEEEMEMVRLWRKSFVKI